MKRIIIDENGNEIDILAERNEKIKAKLEETVKSFKNEEKYDRTGRKRFGFRLLMQIENELGTYGRMTAQEFTTITADDIDDLWLSFHSLMTHFNQFFEIVPNRQSFLLFARMNSRQYKMLMEHQDEDIRSVIAFIEDRLIGKGFSAGENGNTNDKAVMGRLKSAGVGHNVVSASEDKMIQAVANKTPIELERELAQLLGTKK